jgi:hypothetical protein
VIPLARGTRTRSTPSWPSSLLPSLSLSQSSYSSRSPGPVPPNGPEPIRLPAYLSSTTTCSVSFYASRSRERPPTPYKTFGYARSCKRTSENNPSRDCLENSWTDRMERFLVAQSVEKEAFHPVPRARGITKWSLSVVSRQSLHVLCQIRW